FWIPLILLFALRNRNSAAPLLRRALDGSTLPLALLVAGCWLSDGPVGVMACYMLAAVALAASLLSRSWAHLLRASIAAALGIALAAFYIIPAAWEQRWVDLRAAIDYPVFRIENNWLFARHTDTVLAPFGMMVYRTSTLAVSMTTVAALGLLVLYLRRKFSLQNGPAPRSPEQLEEKTPLARRWWIPLALIPAAVLFLQFPVSLPIWNLLPKLRFLQYPWRWVLVLEAPMAIFFAAAVWPSRSARRWQRATVASVCGLFFLAATAWAATTFLRVCQEGDTIADLLAMVRGGGGLEGTDEYEPPGTDHWKIATGLPDACLTADADTTLGIVGEGDSIPNWQPDQRSCEATVIAQLRQPEHLRIATVAAHPGFLILRLLSYPAWRITVNGQPAAPLPARDDGLIAVPVPQGPVDLRVDWTTTSDAVAGRWLSGLTLVLLVGLGLLERKHSSPRL
ncbi:MAG: hypothetical protein P4L26_11360, partial [Terracidiphilus sp.]|nr:hypothetical protein [Terracidiphilus sp.]